MSAQEVAAQVHPVRAGEEEVLYRPRQDGAADKHAGLLPDPPYPPDRKTDPGREGSPVRVDGYLLVRAEVAENRSREGGTKVPLREKDGRVETKNALEMETRHPRRKEDPPSGLVLVRHSAEGVDDIQPRLGGEEGENVKEYVWREEGEVRPPPELDANLLLQAEKTIGGRVRKGSASLSAPTPPRHSVPKRRGETLPPPSFRPTLSAFLSLFFGIDPNVRLRGANSTPWSSSLLEGNGSLRRP